MFRENENDNNRTRKLNDLAEPGDAVADLSQTVSATPTQAEVQAISDKVDELLAALRDGGAIAE